ncbi:hypothetical protein DL240_10970 [Lujinxingia litoralis]|uniref:DUF4175 domain-containing protein n=1 Tax=Lujinxingia litoralis TaxID=2211119 RepID=A0A328C9R7_9DELT|nr:DUF4175 family protein [Lujinxingia litoralis]RAL22363.1 hypothetical protein DL240_10970 [Lujinxingia litoralis]
MHDDTKQPLPDDQGAESGEARASLSAPEIVGASVGSSGERGAPAESKASEGGHRSERSGNSQVSASLRALEVLLRRTERELRRPILLEGGLWAASGALAVALSALAVAAMFEVQGALVARWILGVGLGAVAISALVAWGLFRARGRGATTTAQLIQRHETSFRNDLVSALEFGRRLSAEGGRQALAAEGVSAGLAAAHVHRALKSALARAREQSLAHLVPARDLRAPLGAAGVLALVLAIPLVMSPGWTLGVLSGDRVGASVAGDRVRERPIVGQIDAVMVYPEYTGLGRQMVRLGSGFLETLEGTEVHLQLVLWPERWQKVELVRSWQGDEGPQEEVLPVKVQGQQGAVSLKLRESGSYTFRALSEDGAPVEDGVSRPIRVVADEVPRVRLTSHSPGPEPLIVQPDEVLELSVEALDDFGLSGLSLAHHFGEDEEGGERRALELRELESKPRALEHTLRFELSALNLQPKDRVSIYFEARDINKVTGPGVGRSEALVIYVESPDDQHMRNIADQQALLEALLLHLADVLEAPPGERVREGAEGQRFVVDETLDAAARSAIFDVGAQHHGVREQILAELDALRARVADDPMMSGRNAALFDGLATQLQRLQQEGGELLKRLRVRSERGDLTRAHVAEIAGFTARVEDELEKALLRFDELLARQKMELVEATAEELKAMRDRLRELLEQYRDTEDPALKKAIEREVQRLRQRMAELMARMQMQMEKLSQEHVNMEALEAMQMESEAAQLGQQLQSIEELLAQDDIEGALAELDKMDELLEGLSAEVDQGMAQSAPEGISELDRQMGELMEDASQLQEMERALEAQTRELDDELAKERRETLQEMVKPAVDEVMREVERQERALDQMEELALPERDLGQVAYNREALGKVRQALEQEDLPLALDAARDSERRLRGMRGTLSLSERYVREPEQLDALRRAGASSERMAERGEKIVEMLDEFMEQAQQQRGSEGQSQRYEELAERQQQVREQAEALRQKVEQTGERFPMVRDQVMPSLEEATEAMEQAEQALRQGQGQPALDGERSALEQLGELGDQMRQAMQRQRRQDQRGQGKQKTEKVEIPGASSREAQERMRREMMEGMREGRLEDYDSEIERYYRSLVE